MMEVKVMNRLFINKTLIFLIIFSALSCSSSQESKVSKIENVNQPLEEDTNKISENLEAHLVFKEDGWEIPDLTKCKIIEKNIKQKFESPKPVFRNVYIPISDELLVTTRLGEMRVTNIHEFIIEERKFCYILVVTYPLSKDPNVYNVGVSTNFTYYDLDGDSIFETSDNRFSYIPLLMPKWIQ